MKIFKDICLLISGALISIIASPYVEFIKRYIIIFMSLLFILIIIGAFDLFALLLAIVYFKTRKDLINKKKIGIYSPNEIIETKTSSWVGINLLELFHYLKPNYKYEKITNEYQINEYPIIFNPYGGVYPEKDTEKLTSLNNIFNYVRAGGIYINIADIPFYYAYDINLKRRVDTTPLSGELGQYRSFLNAIVSKKLHTYISGKTYIINNISVNRLFSVSLYSIDLFNSSEKTDGFNISPVIAIPYGKGWFIFSSIEIKKDNLNHLSFLIDEAYKLL